MNKKREDAVFDHLHEIREEIFMENKSKPLNQQVSDNNKKAENILKKWGIKLEKADYLLHTVK
jgi:diketogulonate reductase-like aldo/keto reductase